MNSRFLLLVALLTLSLCWRGSAQTTRPVDQIEHGIIISIDGLRPDVMLRADTPNLRRLFESGSFSFWAQTVPVAITLPSHVSMLTGESVERHGIRFNDERATTRPLYPNAVTIFELAKKAGLTTALVSGKSKFHALAKPGTVDWFSAPEDPKTTDATVADNAGAILRLHKPNLMFIHFPGADNVGHAKGWGTREQMEAIEQIDQSLGMLLNAIETSGMNGKTFIIISSDHGGSARKHGQRIPNSRNIPWILWGPRIRANFDLTLLENVQINTTDTFATACHLLGLPLPEGIEGKPIIQAIEQAELLQDVTPTPAPAATTAPTAAAPAR